MVKLAAMSKNDKYYEWLKEIGEAHDWQLNKRIYYADDHTVSQMYLDLYREYKDESMMEPTKKQFDYILFHPAKTSLHWKSPYNQDRGSWCDALFMAPPVWANYTTLQGKKNIWIFYD